MPTYETSGTLITTTKSFSSATTPNLDSVSYSLNGEAITVDVVGSPSTASEEIVTVSLDGSSSYEIYDQWASSHTDFRLEITLSTNDDSTTPSFNEATLVTPSVSESNVFVSPTSSLVTADETTSANETSDVDIVATPFTDDVAVVAATSFITTSSAVAFVDEEAIANEMTDVVPMTSSTIADGETAVATENDVLEVAVGSTVQAVETTIAVENTFVEGDTETIEAFLVPLHRIGLFANDDSEIVNT